MKMTMMRRRAKTTTTRARRTRRRRRRRPRCCPTSTGRAPRARSSTRAAGSAARSRTSGRADRVRVEEGNATVYVTRRLRAISLSACARLTHSANLAATTTMAQPAKKAKIAASNGTAGILLTFGEMIRFALLDESPPATATAPSRNLYGALVAMSSTSRSRCPSPRAHALDQRRAAGPMGDVVVERDRQRRHRRRPRPANRPRRHLHRAARGEDGALPAAERCVRAARPGDARLANAAPTGSTAPAVAPHDGHHADGEHVGAASWDAAILWRRQRASRFRSISTTASSPLAELWAIVAPHASKFEVIILSLEQLNGLIENRPRRASLIADDADDADVIKAMKSLRAHTSEEPRTCRKMRDAAGVQRWWSLFVTEKAKSSNADTPVWHRPKDECGGNSAGGRVHPRLSLLEHAAAARHQLRRADLSPPSARRAPATLARLRGRARRGGGVVRGQGRALRRRRRRGAGGGGARPAAARRETRRRWRGCGRRARSRSCAPRAGGGGGGARRRAPELAARRWR